MRNKITQINNQLVISAAFMLASGRRKGVNGWATHPTIGNWEAIMSKGMDSKKNAKKKPLKTPAEKRADKRAKKGQTSGE